MNELLSKINQYPVIKHFILAVLAFFGFIWLVSIFLKIFTHHGEAIVLPDYTGNYVEMIMDDAKKRKLRPVVIDSIFVLGKNGGLILSQNPLPGERVKRNRKVYLTVTKTKADEVISGRLPILYGKSYERKSRELKQGFELFTKIVDYRFDPGPENYILAVLYEGDTIVSSTIRKMDVPIEKGATLEFVLSKSTGGVVDLPNLVCKSYAEALFLCKSSRLNLSVVNAGGSENKMTSFIHHQEPLFSPGTKITMGDTIFVELQSMKPSFCLEDN